MYIVYYIVTILIVYSVYIFDLLFTCIT